MHTVIYTSACGARLSLSVAQPLGRSTCDGAVASVRLLDARCVRLWQALDDVLAVRDVHDGDARDLSDATLQLAIARRDQVASVLLHALEQAVVGVRAFVCAGQALEARVLR